MSALGQKRTCAVQNAMSALPPKADIRQAIAMSAKGTLERATQSLIRDGELLFLASRLVVEQRGARKG